MALRAKISLLLSYRYFPQFLTSHNHGYIELAFGELV